MVEVYFLISQDNVRITITITKSMHELLKNDAAYEDRSVSNLVCRIIKQYYNLGIEE